MAKAELGTESTSTVPVDVKKVDYTVRDWDDTDKLKEHLNESRRNPEKLIRVIDDHGAGLRPVMHILGRGPGNTRVHLRVHGIKPYFYVPYDEFGETLQEDGRVIGWEKGHENIAGEHMVKIYTRIPGDVPKVRNDYEHHEADILFPNRFLIDEEIQGSLSIPEEHATPEPTDITADDIGDATYNRPSRVCFCDIEVDDSTGFPSQDVAEKEIISITVYDSYRGDYQIFMYHPELPSVSHEQAKIRIFDTEVGMMRGFVDYLGTRDFDAITGWNFTDFDSRYLLNRIDNLEDRDDVENLEKEDMSSLGSAYDDGYFGAKIKGLAVFDLLRGYKNLQFTELDSYRLEDVAQEVLGTGKIKDDRSVYELWKQDPQKLVEYNVKDVELTVMLEEQQGIIKFYEEIANYAGGRFGEMSDVTRPVDMIVLRAVNGVWALPSAKNVKTEKFEGAKVFDPIMGVKENVVVLDLASLYPMSMKTINAGPETKDPAGELKAPNGIKFNNDEDAVVVEIIDDMLEERQRYKDLRDEHPVDSKQYDNYDRKQSAVKVVMNTLYGVMGWDRFRLQDKDVGAAVTAVGREVIKFTERVVEDMGYETVYGDTDSVMIHLGPDHTKDDVKKIGMELEQRINDAYDDFARDRLNADEHFFDIEFEKLYRRFFQAGKKKRYAGHITWKEGKNKDSLDIVGFEYQRSDYSKVAKQLMKRVFGHILRGGTLDGISEDVNTVVDKLTDEEFDPDTFGIPASISQNFDEYETDTVAVKGALYANENFDAGIQPGDKPKMNYVERVLPDSDGLAPYSMPDTDPSKSQPCCWMNYSDIPELIKWDWDEYIDKQIKRPIARILEGTEWSWDEAITGNRQPRLGEYKFEDNASESGQQPVKVGEEEVVTEGSDDFDSDEMFPWEEQELEARNAVSETQEALESWEDDDSEDGDVVEASMVEREDGPTSLEDYL
jgi:DNA polymerase elongation subunit (family B)